MRVAEERIAPALPMHDRLCHGMHLISRWRRAVSLPATPARECATTHSCFSPRAQSARRGVQSMSLLHQLAHQLSRSSQSARAPDPNPNTSQRPRHLTVHVTGPLCTRTSSAVPLMGAVWSGGVHSASTPTTPLDAIGYICTGKGCNVQLLCTSIRALRYVPSRPLCAVHCNATVLASTPTGTLR